MNRFDELFSCKEDIAQQFCVSMDELRPVEIIYAYYDHEAHGCDGEAYVAYVWGNKIFEASGSHCSCYGLEDQWDPTEVTIEELEERVARGGHWNRFASIVLEELKLEENTVFDARAARERAIAAQQSNVDYILKPIEQFIMEQADNGQVEGVFVFKKSDLQFEFHIHRICDVLRDRGFRADAVAKGDDELRLLLGW